MKTNKSLLTKLLLLLLLLLFLKKYNIHNIFIQQILDFKFFFFFENITIIICLPSITGYNNLLLSIIVKVL